MNGIHPVPLSLLSEVDQAMRRLLFDADFGEGFPYIFGHPDENGPEVTVRSLNGLLLHKARLHLVAALRAYEKGNLHSMAVHLRVVMECAGQVVSEAWALCEESPKGLERFLNTHEGDFRRAMLSSSRGQVSRQQISEIITSAREGIGLYDGKQPTSTKRTENVSYLNGGEEWYRFLSGHFLHPNLEVLSGPAHIGGVTAVNVELSRMTSEILLERLTRWLLDMLLANGLLTSAAGGGGQLFDEAMELRQRWDTSVESPTPTGPVEIGYLPVDLEEANVNEDGWRAACRWSTEALLELMKIHLVVDPPGRDVSESEPQHTLRLRKVQFHVRAIILWPITPEALHVMGPDVRAAREQLNEMIQDGGELWGSVAANVKEFRRQLEPFSHPTTGTVWQSRSFGGFGKVGGIPWQGQLGLLLLGLVCDYAYCLGETANLLEPSVVREILGIIERCPHPEFTELVQDAP